MSILSKQSSDKNDMYHVPHPFIYTPRSSRDHVMSLQKRETHDEGVDAKLDPSFWRKFQLKKDGPPPPKNEHVGSFGKRPESLARLRESLNAASSSSSHSLSGDDDDDGGDDEEDDSAGEPMEVIAPPKPTISSYKRPRHSIEIDATLSTKQMTTTAEKSAFVKAQIGVLLSNQATTLARRAKLEADDRELAERKRAYQNRVLKHRLSERQVPRELCTESPLLAKILAVHSAPKQQQQLMSVDRLVLHLANYDADRIFLQVAQGRLVLQTGVYVQSLQQHRQHEYVIARRVPDDGVEFYVINRVS
jgi:hypothetical protein